MEERKKWEKYSPGIRIRMADGRWWMVCDLAIQNEKSKRINAHANATNRVLRFTHRIIVDTMKM